MSRKSFEGAPSNPCCRRSHLTNASNWCSTRSRRTSILPPLRRPGFAALCSMRGDDNPSARTTSSSPSAMSGRNDRTRRYINSSFIGRRLSKAASFKASYNHCGNRALNRCHCPAGFSSVLMAQFYAPTKIRARGLTHTVCAWHIVCRRHTRHIDRPQDRGANKYSVGSDPQSQKAEGASAGRQAIDLAEAGSRSITRLRRHACSGGRWDP